MMLGMTGFSDYRELATTLFQTLALIEMQQQASMEVDQSITKKLEVTQ